MVQIDRVYDTIRREERARQRQRIDAAYARIPALASVDRERQTVFQAVAARSLTPVQAQMQLTTLAVLEQELLKQAGLAPDALALHYRCEQCRDTGYLGDGLKRPCACRLKLRAKLDPSVQINDRETFEAFDASIYPSEQQKKQALVAKKHCEAFADALPSPSHPNLLLMGMAGLGKSYFGNAIAYRALGMGIDTVRTTAYGFLQDMLSDIRGEGRLAQRYRTAPLLVLDDLGTEPVIPNVSEESLFAVVNERVATGRATVLATNLSFVALQERYGERVFSRLSDSACTRVLRLEGDNLRWRKPPC